MSNIFLSVCYTVLYAIHQFHELYLCVQILGTIRYTSDEGKRYAFVTLFSIMQL